jgi:hypothetical protein
MSDALSIPSCAASYDILRNLIVLEINVKDEKMEDEGGRMIVACRRRT